MARLVLLLMLFAALAFAVAAVVAVVRSLAGPSPQGFGRGPTPEEAAMPAPVRWVSYALLLVLLLGLSSGWLGSG